MQIASVLNEEFAVLTYITDMMMQKQYMNQF